MPLLALDLGAAGLFISSAPGLIVCVVVGGLLLGVINTVLTECVMEATDLARSVASSAYSGVRFLGGAIAPPVATLLAAAIAPSTPFFVAAASVIVAVLIVIFGRKHLSRADGAVVDEPMELEELEELEAIAGGNR